MNMYIAIMNYSTRSIILCNHYFESFENNAIEEYLEKEYSYNDSTCYYMMSSTPIDIKTMWE